MTEHRFQVGDPVWTKMKGYPFWPSRIAGPHEANIRNVDAEKSKVPKIYYLVYFFGSNNFAWQPEDTIKPYAENSEEYSKKSKNANFKKGLKAIQEYIEQGGKATLAQPPADSTSDVASAGKELPSIDEELDVIRNSKDYSRTPFNSNSKPKANSTEVTSPTKRIRSDDDDFGAPSLPKSQPPSSKIQARNIITRVQPPLERPAVETPQVNAGSLANRYKNIRSSSLKFGFIGLGMMGQRLVRHLLESGHQVTLYNRNLDRLEGFKDTGASLAQTPSDVISASDITFTCVSGTTAVKEMLFSKFGILSEMTSKKALVDLGSSDPEGSSDISEAIISKQGSFLAAPVISCGKTAAQNGDLMIVASGDRAVYEDCASCFKAMAKKSLYLGSDYCQAPKMGLVLSAFYGTIVGSLIECLRLVDQLTLKKDDFMDILKSSLMNSQLTELMGKKILSRDMAVEMPLNYLQKDLKMALNLSNDRPIGCPITAIVNEIYKSRCSFSDSEDVTAVFYG